MMSPNVSGIVSKSYASGPSPARRRVQRNRANNLSVDMHDLSAIQKVPNNGDSLNQTNEEIIRKMGTGKDDDGESDTSINKMPNDTTAS